MSICRSFTRTFDRDRDHKLSYTEFENGIRNYGLHFDTDEMKGLFVTFDKDRSGTINFDEFLERLRVSCLYLHLKLHFVMHH